MTGIAMNQQPAQQSTKQSIDQETQQSIQHVTTLQQWRRETLFTSAADYYADLLEHIACARRSIILESYIFELDTIGKPLLHSLCLAAERGVKVKLLIDGIGSYQCASDICRQLHQAGAKARIFHPLPWQWHLFKISIKRHNWLFGSLYYSWVINRRDHRKLVIIDTDYLYNGSINVCAKHLGRQDGGEDWIDYAARVEGSGIAELSANFQHLWQAKTLQQRGPFHSYLSNLSDASRHKKNRHVIDTILNARQRVWLYNAYFAPTKGLLRALASAAKRGLDIRIMVAGLSDIKLFPYLSSHYYRGLLQLGIRLFEIPDRVLHAKAALIDDSAIIGSTNLNRRSHQHDLELDLLLHQPRTLEQLQAHMQQLQDSACELHLSSLPKRSALLCSLARSLRYWM